MHIFQEDPPRTDIQQDIAQADALLLSLDGYEGPIDVLLDLARKQKVDLMQISILQLARQYLIFVERAKAHNLELAAEYLVMAAWLAYLKSRLLLPQEKSADEVSAEDMAEALQFQLLRLEAMQNAGQSLKNRPQLGNGLFARGMKEDINTVTKIRYDVTLIDLLKGYGDIQKRTASQNYELPIFSLMSMDSALNRMTKMLGRLPKSGMKSVWATLESFIPEGIKNRLFGKSAIASTLTAGLELAKQGKLEIRQEGLFKPIYVRGLDGE
jgi:segregation and condensation protein A